MPAHTRKTQAQDQELKILDELNQQQHICLAMNIYYEARGSSMADQVATADVVLNRVASDRYPNTVCEVVHQGKQKPSWKDPSKMVMVRNMCQFSWYCDGKADIPKDEQSWSSAQMVAFSIMIYGKYRGLTEGATHYHATWTLPYWADSLNETVVINEHIFYK